MTTINADTRSIENGHRDANMPARIFVAMARHSWGQGESIAAAIKECRDAGGSGRRGKDIKVYLLPEYATGARVNGMGDLCWTGPNNAICEVS